MKKTLLHRFILGIKVGWNTPLLPDKVHKFNNHPIIRVFRVVGGVSVFTVIMKKHLIFFAPLQYIILLLTFTHIFYYVIINITKVFYGIYKLFSGDLDIKNSPLDRFANYSGKNIYCWKVGCYVGSSGLGIATTSVVADTILEAGGQEKVFTPLIGKGVKYILGGKPANQDLLDIQNNVKKLEDSKKTMEEISETLEAAKKALDNS